MRPTIADQIWAYVLPRKGDYRNPLRWSHGNDWWWGPFTFSWNSYNNFGLIISSYGGGEDDDRPASVRIMGGKAVLIVRLPRWAVPGPTVTRTYPDDPAWKAPDGEVYKRLGRDYYEEADAHEYGFNISGAGTVGNGQFLQVKLGRSTYDSSTDRSWSKFLPWTTFRHVRISFFNLDGSLFSEVYDGEHPARSMLFGGDRPGRYDIQRDLEARAPKVRYAFKDYDGEELVATCHIEEREWRAGEGWFKWLSWFRKPIICRSLSIKFSGETGRRKGSWKGGTTGTGIEMDRGPDGQFFEGTLGAFMRYCSQNDMTFTGIAVDTGQESASSASHYS